MRKFLVSLVELVRLYSNPAREAAHLRRARSAASTHRPAGGRKQPRQHQRRLTMTEITELMKEYQQGASVKELAQRFGIHRVTATAVLQRHGVELRRSGLVPADIPAAASLYDQGWSLARLGERLGVDAATVWRALRAAGVEMRMPSQRPARSE
jgi:lambda repressor-like predicted transcriptional regulator